MSELPLGVSVRLLYPFAAALEHEGVERDDLLQSADLPRALFDDPHARISYEVAGRFLRAAIARTRHRALGLQAARHQDAAQFQLLEYFVASSARVETAISDLVRYQGVLGDARVLSAEPRGDDLFLRYQPVAPAPRAVVEYVLGSLLLSAKRSLRGRADVPRASNARILSVCFAFPEPQHAREEYAAFFDSRVVFDAPHHGLLVSRDIVQHRIARANPIAHELLEAQIKAQDHVEEHTRSFGDRALAVIGNALAADDLSQDAIAHALHLSRSTLKRRLAAEGTSLRELIDNARRASALRSLEQPSTSVQEAAAAAGFTDVTAFSKAFKRWTGCSPTEHRERSRKSR